ncbi:MAG: hypothetical protein IT535_13400 [Bauldia sp.]|nr:hypothetical protein [Bauldia sp.]
MTIPLAFYCYPKKGAIDDFREVARRIEARAPDIRPRVFSSTINLATLFGTLSLPKGTVSIELDRVKLLAPRGKRLSHGRIPKLEQLRGLREAGIKVPRWTEIGPDTKLDPGEWGPYVVVKPSRGSRGANVRIQKTSRVRYKAPDEFPADHAGRKGPMIAQQFVYTGKWPVAAKVLTYFGTAVAAMEYHGREELLPLTDRDRFGDAPGSSIVASAMGARMALCDDPEVPRLAERVHALWPDQPSLGVDIVRDSQTGELFVLELNPTGNSWILSGAVGESAKHQFGIDLHAQFGALDILTETSIAVARRFAEAGR